MANIAIIVGSIGVQNALLHLSGVALVDPGTIEFSWDASVAWSANPIVVGIAIRDAAVAAAAAQGITVSPADQKTVFGGPSVN